MTIRLCMTRGTALSPARGFGDPEVERSFARARALSEASNDLPQLFQSLIGLSATHIAQARFDRATEVTRQLLTRMHEMPFPAFVFGGHMFAGIVALSAGSLTDARRHLEEANAIGYMPLPAMSVDLRLFALGYLGMTLLHQGYPDQALARIEQATALAAEVGRPYDLASVSQLACVFLLQTRDFGRLARTAEDAVALGSANGFRSAAAIGSVCRGRVLGAQSGGDEQGVALMKEGIDAYRTSGQLVALASLLAALAEGYAEVGAFAPALDCILEARAVAESSGEVRYRAELHRLEGEIRLRDDDRDAAETCFRRALEVAREQGARWWELRATVSWSRMQTGQSGRRAARRALSTIVASFAEGLQTADMEDARALLAEVG